MTKRFCAVPAKRHFYVVAAAGSLQFSAGEKEDPYGILGISPVDGFDKVKMAYKRRRKDAESSRDAGYLLERAYDTVMMEQLQNRKKGVAYWHMGQSRYSRSTAKDLHINMAISAAFIMCISTMGHADWKPLQFLCFAYFYRILEKLKATEPAITPVYNEYGEVEGWGIHMAKRVLRSLGLVLGSTFAAWLVDCSNAVGYTGLANFSQFLGQYIPSIVYNFQDVDCDYSFICFALHLGFVPPIAICAGLPPGFAVLIHYHSPTFRKGHAR